MRRRALYQMFRKVRPFVCHAMAVKVLSRALHFGIADPSCKFGRLANG